MPIAVNALPYGLRDVKLTPIDAAGAYGTMVDLPASRTLSWTESVDSNELRGDDVIQATRESSPKVDWDLEQGGISLDAYKVIAGGLVSSTGVSPNVVKTWAKLGTDNRPYFRIDGQAINDNGGDTKVVIYKAKAIGDIQGSFEGDTFLLTQCSGTSFPNAANKLYDIIQYETSAAIVQPV